MAGTHSKSSTITTRIAQILRSRKFRRENRSVIAVLALVVVLGVAAVLMQHGLAKHFTVRVLDCHYIGNVAHKHNQDCYDADGNLVCPLRERELHTHTEDCYDAKGNLICGKEELTEEHIHGDGCFVTIASASADNPTTASTAGEVAPEQAENPTPAMTFSHTFVDGEDNPVLAVEVDAPEGALPKDTTMEATWVTPYEVNKDDVQKAVSSVSAGKVLDLQAVDITFYDGSHNEIEPASDVIVTFTSDMLANTSEKAQVVHMESEEEAAKRGKDAEPQAACVKTIPQGALADDQVAFESADFSQYVIALVSSDVTATATGAGAEITINATPDAGLPQGTAIDAGEISPDDSAYTDLVRQAQTAAGVDKTSYVKAFDITLKNGDTDIEPQSPVQATISLDDLPDGGSFAVAHYNETTLETELVPSWVSDGAVVFEAASFSPYVIIQVDKDDPVDPDAGTGTLRLITTVGAADGEVNLDSFIGDFTFQLQSTADGNTDTTPITLESSNTSTTEVYDLPAGTYTVTPNLQDTDDYNITVTLTPANGEVEITNGGITVLQAAITVGRKPFDPVVGGLIDVRIDKQWKVSSGQDTSWPPDAEPLIQIRRLRSRDEGYHWEPDTSYSDSIYLNHTGSTMLYDLEVEDQDEAGVLYKYYIFEEQIPNGYTSTTKIGGNEIATYDKNDPIPEQALQDAALARSATITLVNTFTGQGDAIDLTVHKDWQDNGGASITPPAGTEATFTLHRAVSTDGGLTYSEDADYEGETKTVGTTDQTFTNLPVVNETGTEIYKYYAKETGIPTGYMPEYLNKQNHACSTQALIEEVATDQTRTQIVRNKKVTTVDVPVYKDWPDFDPTVHANATWSADFVLERAEVTSQGQASSFKVLDANDIRTLTNGGELVFADLPVYRYDEDGNQHRFVYSVKEVGYTASRPQNGSSEAKSVTWNGTGDPEYYTVFIQDAGDPEVDVANNLERWYQIHLANIKSDLEKPSKTTTINLTKTWNTEKQPSAASFELIRFEQESYRDWSSVADADFNDKSSWKPAQLNQGGNTSTTISMPNGAPVWVVVNYSDNERGPNSKITVTYIDDQGNSSSVDIERGPGNNAAEQWSQSFAPYAASGASVREVTLSGPGLNHISGAYLSDVEPSTNTAVQDALASTLDMNANNHTSDDGSHQVWTGQFYNHLEAPGQGGSYSNVFPLTQSMPMVGRHQTVFNYSYYVRETSSTPAMTATIKVNGATHDSTHRIDATSGDPVNVEVTNRDKALFTVHKDWADVINPYDRYPTVFFTLYQKKAGANRGEIFTHPDFDADYFKDIPLSRDNNFEWTCPIELPATTADGSAAEYYVIEKTTDGNSNNNTGGVKAYTEPAAINNNYVPEVKKYYAYSGHDNQIDYSNYSNIGPTQPSAVSVKATPMSNGDSAIGGDISIRNNPPKSDQMDMIKKKWISYGSQGNLVAVADANMNNCIIKYEIKRRALDETDPEYNNGDLPSNYSGSALVHDWEDWYYTIYQGYDENGNPTNSVIQRDFNEWKYAGAWHWTLNKNNEYGGGLEYRGFENVNGQIKPVAYQYIFIEIGCYKITGRQQTPYGEEILYDNFSDDFDYYAIVPASWTATGQKEIFPAIVAQDQDRITNVVAADLRLDKVWGAAADLTDVEEVYVKVYRNYKQGSFKPSDDFIVTTHGHTAQDVVAYARSEASSMISDYGMVPKDRYVQIGGEWYLKLTKNENSIMLENLPLGTGPNAEFQYWVEEVAWKDTNGTIHNIQDEINDPNTTPRFRPTYLKWDADAGKWVGETSDPYEARFQLGPNGKNTPNYPRNRIEIDNSPTKDVRILKRWLDENGEDTSAWKTNVTYNIERQARRYTNIGTTDEIRWLQDMWYSNDGGNTWITRQEFNDLPDQSGYTEATAFGANVGGTFTPSAWEKLTFKIGSAAATSDLTVANTPVKYTVKSDTPGSASYTGTSGAPGAGDVKPSYTDGSGQQVTAQNWYDIVSGLANSVSIDEDGDGVPDVQYKYTYRVAEVTPADQGNYVTYEPTTGSLESGQATIVNGKNSLRIVKRWYDADGTTELPGPWANGMEVKVSVRAKAQKWVYNRVTSRWVETGDPEDRGVINANGKFEMKEANQIVTATRDTSDPNHATYTFSVADASAGMKISNREHWAMRVDGLESEYLDPSNNDIKYTFTYEIVEDPIDGAITTCSPHVVGNDSIGRVSNGRSVDIRNKKNPIELKPQKVFKGISESDLFETDANDPTVKHIKAPMSNIRFRLENTTPSSVPPTVTSLIVFDDTLGNLYDGGVLTYEVDANDPTQITLSASLKPGTSFPNYNGTINTDAIVTGADYKLSETVSSATVPTGYQYSDAAAVKELTKNVDADGTDGKLTITLENPHKKVIITAKKDFEGIDIADFIETDDSTTPPTEHVKEPLKDITLKLVNQTKSKTIFEDTIENLFDGGVITYAYDPATKKLTFTTQISTDSEFPNYNGTIDKSGLVGGDTYKLTEGGADTHVPNGYQFRAADATGEDSGAPAASGNDEGKLTLELANPYNEIKIHVEKKFTGLDDIFAGVTNAKIVDDYDSLDEGVKKVLEGVKLSLKNKTKSTSTADVYVFQNKSLKELIQSGVLTYDGQSVKVAGDITKATTGINVDALVGGCEYELTESGADLAASIPTGYVYVAGESKTSDTKTLDATTAELSVDCENKYIPTIDIKVYKVSENEAGTGPDTTANPLEGATFVLEKGEFVTDDVAGTTTWNKTGEITITETSTKGIFDVTGLEAGSYKLIEHDVPNGYIKYDYDPIFNVVYNSQTKMLELEEVTTDPVTGKDIAKASEVVVDATTHEVRVYVSNPPGSELPHSGGPGTILMTVAGLVLVAAASMYLLKTNLKLGSIEQKIG